MSDGKLQPKTDIERVAELYKQLGVVGVRFDHTDTKRKVTLNSKNEPETTYEITKIGFVVEIEPQGFKVGGYLIYYFDNDGKFKSLEADIAYENS